MFTGIIQSVGRLRGRVAGRRGLGEKLWVECAFTGLTLGESVAMQGVCLTVSTLKDGGFEADASDETLARSTLGGLKLGQRVNLERALCLGERLGGHLVAGHVDGVGQVLNTTKVGEAERWEFSAPAELMRFLAEKGSVAIDGVSLTVNHVGPKSFEVMLVPFTQGATALGDCPPGGRVNLEVDVLARYVARAMAYSSPRGGSAGGLSLETLINQGFLEK